jgi:3-isopropylmalate dehydratase small subunit
MKNPENFGLGTGREVAVSAETAGGIRFFPEE